MSYPASAPTSARRQQRRRRAILAATVVLVAAILIGLRGYPLLEARSSPTPSLAPSLPAPSTSTASPAQTRSPSVSPTRPRETRTLGREPHQDHHGNARERSRAVADGTTVFDDDVPAVAELDPDLLIALRRAATD